MLGFVEVFGGVLILGRVATTHLPTNEAQTQVDPRVSHFHALFTHVLVGFSEFDLVEMSAFGCHWFLLGKSSIIRQVTSVM
jgi:hypothetical protein